MTPGGADERLEAAGLRIAAKDAAALAALLDDVAGATPWSGAVPHVMAMRLLADVMEKWRPAAGDAVLVHEGQTIILDRPLGADVPLSATGSIGGAEGPAPVLVLDFACEKGEIIARTDTRLRLAKPDAIAAARNGRTYLPASDAIRLAPVGQSRVAAYAEIMRDFNPIHLDPEAAAKAGLGDTVVHGMMLVGIAEACLLQHWPHYRLAQSRTRFLSPVLASEGLVLSIADRGVDAQGRILARSSIASGGPLACVVDVVLVAVDQVR